MRFLPVVLLVGLAGCGRLSFSDTQSSQKTDVATTRPGRTPGDSGSVATLKKLGGVVTRNENGDIVDVAFYNTRITDSDLALLTELTSLQTLSLRYNPQVTDAGLVHLQGLPDLKTFSLMGHKFTDAGLAHVKGLTNVESLNLNVTKITDSGLMHLSGLAKLKHLNLSGHAITITGLRKLKGLANLRSMTLACPINDSELSELRKEMPKCEIQRYGLGV